MLVTLYTTLLRPRSTWSSINKLVDEVVELRKERDEQDCALSKLVVQVHHKRNRELVDSDDETIAYASSPEQPLGPPTSPTTEPPTPKRRRTNLRRVDTPMPLRQGRGGGSGGGGRTPTSPSTYSPRSPTGYTPTSPSYNPTSPGGCPPGSPSPPRDANIHPSARRPLKFDD